MDSSIYIYVVYLDMYHSSLSIENESVYMHQYLMD